MNCIIGQSGGPTSVINSSLAGAITSAIENKFEHIYAMENGIAGLIEGRILEIDQKKYLDKNVEEKLKSRPASILGSCRYKLPEDLNDDVYRKIFERLKILNIKSFLYIGGNDSMDTVMKLNEYITKNDIKGINVIGIPKTIDNDLCQMDHSPGFGSAAKFVISNLKMARTDVDIYNLRSVTIIEIMGRNAGWLAASSLLVNIGSNKRLVNLLYLRENVRKKEEILDEIKKEFEKDHNILIAVSEGFMDSEGYFEKEESLSFDNGFGHPVISGIAQKLASYIKDELKVKTRAIELNILQRSNYLISKIDSQEAFILGKEALKLSIEKTNLIPVIKRKDSKDYQSYIAYVEPDKIANKEKLIPKDWLTSYQHLEEKMIEYVKPLLKGEIDQIYEDGIITFIKLEEFSKKIY